MATTSFVLDISHSQIAVFDSGLAEPFNMWTERHVNQGFAWRERSVSFRTIEDGGQHIVEVIVASEDPGLSPEAVRAIQVPFDVPSSGSIEIASISDAFPIELSSGMYALRFECFRSTGNQNLKIKLVFVKKPNPTFAVLRRDAELVIDGELLLSA